MAALIIPQSTSFGGMTNRIVSQMLTMNTNMERLKDALATASAGFVGTPGTQYEAGNAMVPGNMYVPNNFGIVPDPAEAGKNGNDYEFAVNTLAAAWAAFWTAASASIEQLDNGAA